MNKKINPEEFQKHIDKYLWNFDAKPLAYAWNSGENILMFGEGGYGKSVVAEMFHKYLVNAGALNSLSKLFVQFMGPGMTEERILGGIDLKEFNEEGRIIYLLEYAFVNYEIVVLEEIWDAYPNVLLVLKDILTSKHVRNGAQQTPIRTKMIIANTNRSREEVVSDNSTEALFQRFIFEHQVNWYTHSVSDYQHAIKRATNINGTSLSVTSMLCAEVSMDKDTDYKVSPRTAVKAAKIYEECGITALSYLYGFRKHVSKAQAMIAEAKKREQEIMEARQKSINICKLIKEAITNENTSFTQMKFLVGDMNQVLEFTKLFKTPDEIEQLEKTKKLLQAVEGLSESLWKKLYESAGNLDEKIHGLMEAVAKERASNFIVKGNEEDHYSSMIFELKKMALSAGVSFNRPSLGTKNVRMFKS
jgi:hypothetical protein